MNKWKLHETNYCPVYFDNLVDVIVKNGDDLSNGVEILYRISACDVDWNNKSRWKIICYRLTDFIRHTGNVCPVLNDQRVEVVLQDNGRMSECFASDLDWSLGNSNETWPIKFYRVIE